MNKIFIILFFLSANLCLAEQRQSMEIIRNFSEINATTILSNFNKKDSIYIDFAGSSADYIFEQSLLKNSGKFYFIKHNAKANQYENQIKVSPIITSVEYKSLNNKDMLRIVKWEFSAVQVKSGMMNLIELPPQTFQDTLTYDEATADSKRLPRFLQTNVPEAPHSFYERIIEPAIIVTSAILTVALFFSIRSK